MSMEEEIVQFQKMEKQLQAIMGQRMQIDAQLVEISNAVKELEASKSSDVYKLVGGIMIKTTVSDAKADLENRKAVLSRGLQKFTEEENSLKDKLSRLSKKLEQFMGKGQS